MITLWNYCIVVVVPPELDVHAHDGAMGAI